MPDINLLGSLNFGGTAQTLATGIYTIIIIGVILGLIYLIYWWTRFKVIFIIRTVTADRTLTYIDRARIIKRKGGVIQWKLKNRRIFVPVPPKEALEVTTKGKLIVEAYYTSDGEYIYIQDKITGRTIDAEGNEVEAIGSLHPLKAVDKEFYVQQLEEAQKYKKKDIYAVLTQIAPVLAVVIIMVVFFVFWDNVVAPANAMASSNQVVAEQIVEALTQLKGCVQNIPIAP